MSALSLTASDAGTIKRDTRPNSGDFESQLADVLPAAFRAAIHLIGDVEQAECAVEEAAMIAFERFPSCHLRAGFRAWFLGIVALRVRARRLEARAAVAGDTVDSALAALPDEDRLALTLHVLGELSYWELGAALNLSAGVARAKVHRGRALLREEIKKAATSGGLAGRRWH